MEASGDAMTESRQAATQKASDEFAKCHEIVRKAWVDAAARLYSALSEMPRSVMEGPFEAQSIDAVECPKKRWAGGTSDRTPAKNKRNRQ